MKEDGGFGNNCSWLGEEFFLSLNGKPFTAKVVLQGIMDHQRTWSILQIKQMKEKNKDQRGLSPEKLKAITQMKLKMVDEQMKAWEAFPEWQKITDEAIKEILEFKVRQYATPLCIKNSPASDAARSAILRLYSYETPLYGALNKANQYQDQRAIQTLGPFAWLLFKIL